jgi:hypothetical protein
MRKKNGVIFVVVGHLIFFFHIQGWAADWKLFLTTNHRHFYYDAESITHSSEGVVRVWCKQAFTEKGVIDMVGILGENFKTLSYWMDLYEVHCTDKKFRRLSSVAYSADGKILHSFEYQGPEWYSISPMLLDILYNSVCE